MNEKKIKKKHPIPSYSDVNFVTLPFTPSIPSPPSPASATMAHPTTTWTSGTWKTAPTCSPSPTKKTTTAHQPCSFKSVGVRYFSDLGRSWTRSIPIPILTHGTQLAANNCSRKGGVGDWPQPGTPTVTHGSSYPNEQAARCPCPSTPAPSPHPDRLLASIPYRPHLPRIPWLLASTL